jgi:hypothetical protein
VVGVGLEAREVFGNDLIERVRSNADCGGSSDGVVATEGKAEATRRSGWELRVFCR